jgi:hypothetical protein
MRIGSIRNTFSFSARSLDGESLASEGQEDQIFNSGGSSLPYASKPNGKGHSDLFRSSDGALSLQGSDTLSCS